jgi:hypothetical protein
MKLIYFFCFLLVLSCSTTKKEYVCGDHPCVDKKEFNEYFSKNLIVEVKFNKNKKDKKIDLVNLNTKLIDKKFIDNNSKLSKKIEARKQKEMKKKEKIRVLEERKIKKDKEKKAIKERKKIAKYSKLKKKNKDAEKKHSNEMVLMKPDTSNSTPKYKEKLIKKSNNNSAINSTKVEDIKDICGDMKDCDINKITELLIKKGRDKPYPNITSN